jgi:ATP-dependent DNA helicase PIF1
MQSRKRVVDGKDAIVVHDEKKVAGEETLNEDQMRAYNLVKNRRNVFVSGAGGTGKSHLLGVVRRWAQARKLMFAVTATTGVAALNIGGVTINSWAGIGLGKESIDTLVAKIRSTNTKRNRYGSALNRWNKTQLLIIDEISMMTPDMFYKLDQIGRMIRQRSAVAFGGIQVMILGDFLQLPPVDRDTQKYQKYALANHTHNHHHHHHQDGDLEKKETDEEKRAKEIKLEQDLLAARYLFHSKSWNSVIQATVLLRRVYRQNEDQFVQLLARIRMGEPTDDDMKLLRSRVVSNSTARIKDANGLDAPMLFATRKAVHEENMRRLQELPGPFLRVNRRTHHVTVKPSTAQPTTATVAAGADEPVPPIVIEQPIYLADTEAQYAAARFANGLTAPDPFVFKMGATVMLLTNLDVQNKLVNGLRGTVVGIGPNPPNQPPQPIAPPIAAAAAAAVAAPAVVALMAAVPVAGLAVADAGSSVVEVEQVMGDGVEEASAADLAAAAALRRKWREQDDAEENPVQEENYRMLSPEEETIWVKFEHHVNPVAINRHKWKFCLKDAERNLPEDTWTEYISVSGIPLAPAYASTIHKTQSLTLTAAVINLGEDVITDGQAYTALSRVASIAGVFIIRIVRRAIRADPVTKQFYKDLALLYATPQPIVTDKAIK